MEHPQRPQMPTMPHVGGKVYYYAFAISFKGKPAVSEPKNTYAEADAWGRDNLEGVVWSVEEWPNRNSAELVRHLRTKILATLPKDGTQLDIAMQRMRHEHSGGQ